MVRRVIARSVFAVAALCAIAASAGLAVPPHEERSTSHAHVLGAYRFGFLLSAAEAMTIPPAMARLHGVLMRAGVPMEAIRQMPGMGHPDLAGALPSIRTSGLSPIQDLAIELALLVALVPSLARPTLRAVARLPLPRLVADLWEWRPALAPPRPSLVSV